MLINLKDSVVFESEEISLDKGVNFIYGKNGTGKSSLTALIEKQILDKDIRIYQNLDSVLVDGKLNAVTLGEENIKVEKNILNLKKQIEKNDEKLKEKELVKERQELKVKELEKDFKAQKNKIEKILTKSARDIKNSPLHIANPLYNRNVFQDEIKYAIQLSQDEIIELKKNISIEEKKAKKFEFNKLDFSIFLAEVNEILLKKVEKEKKIIRLSDEKKINFAHLGKELHSIGDKCSFCGNILTPEIYYELESFFSESKIKEFQIQIDNKIEELERILSEIKIIKIDSNQFYSSYIENVEEIKRIHEKNQEEIKEFLIFLIHELEKKHKKLFSVGEEIDVSVPSNLDTIQSEYNQLVDKNNSEDLLKTKKWSMDILRFNQVYISIVKVNYFNEEKKIKEKWSEVTKNREELSNIDTECNLIIDDIRSVMFNIENEYKKTKSEIKLCENINDKLRTYVSFELEHFPEKNVSAFGRGMYRVKNIGDEEHKYRDVDSLSKGEKNIIGFLYFIEKLKEVDTSIMDKVIIFDDPMDSNDDTMQYVIITEIQGLIKQIDKGNKNKLIIMTHNPHFYINVKFNRLYKNGVDRHGKAVTNYDRFIHLNKLDSKTKVKVLKSEGEDFNTSYQLLWKELYFLYKNDRPTLMLNSIRRIIETFTKFNNIDNFYGDNKDFQKLLNVNSHSIDDLEMELNGKTSEQVIAMMRKSFESQGSIKHFKANWKLAGK